MGLLQFHSDGVKLEDGESEFLFPVYAEEIHSREVRQSEHTHPELGLTPLGYIRQLLRQLGTSRAVSIEIQFLQQWSNRVILPLYLYLLFNFSGDVLEQTGVGSRSRCCWRCWCSKVPVNLRHVCGGKRFMARLLAADGITLLQLFTRHGLFLLIAAFFFPHLFFLLHLLVFMVLVRKTTHCSFMDALRLMSSMVF